MDSNSFQNLTVWQKSIDLVMAIYDATKSMPEHEKFGVISQIRRASVSIPSNIAEGQGRRSDGILPDSAELVLVLAVKFKL